MIDDQTLALAWLAGGIRIPRPDLMKPLDRG
jgi:hypothetical protein